MKKALRILAFFPSVNFGLTQAEVFPYAFFYSVFLTRRLAYFTVVFVCLLPISALYGFYRYGTLELLQFVRSAAAYLNPLLIFVAILICRESEIEALGVTAKRVFTFMLVLGVLQFSGIIAFLDPVIEALVPRGSASVLGFRGVSILATEPARAGIELVFLYAWYDRMYPSKGRSLVRDLLFFGYILVIIKSATAMFLVFLYIAVKYIGKRIFLLPLLVPLIVGVFYFADGRAATLIRDVMALPFKDGLWLIMNTSGNRVVSIYAALHFALHNPLGGGVGYWEHSSVEAIRGTGIDYGSLNYFRIKLPGEPLSFRSSGYFMNLLMDMGIGAVWLLIALLARVGKFIRRNSLSLSNEFPFLLLFLINILIVGSVGAPVPWIVAALYLRQLRAESSVRASRTRPELAVAL